MFCASYFDDGYSQSGYIAAVPRLHAVLRFIYRPALIEERSQLVDAARKLNGPQYDRQLAKFSAEKILSWDLTDARQQPVPVALATLLRLQPELFVKLHHVVLGWVASDVDPAWPTVTRERLLEESTAAQLSGQSIGNVCSEGDEKN